jgi:hypothetical protein
LGGVEVDVGVRVDHPVDCLAGIDGRGDDSLATGIANGGFVAGIVYETDFDERCRVDKPAILTIAAAVDIDADLHTGIPIHMTVAHPYKQCNHIKWPIIHAHASDKVSSGIVVTSHLHISIAHYLRKNPFLAMCP